MIMTIPITLIAPWVIFALISALVGIFLHFGTRYPKDPTFVGWLIWAISLYAAQATIYATWRGWVHWS
jgi:hypothetical protein